MSDKNFPELPSGYPFPRLEEETLERWRELRIFERSLEVNPPGERDFVFYEGPPTANNVPHVGHVVSRAVKDLFPRYRTMRGYHVARKAGWDTHGLPVEIEVEKRLGFSGKKEIEEYGIARFNEACLESVHTYERQWRAMTERIGFWVDLDDAYFTYTNRYVESVWWALARLWREGLLEQDYKIQPYCARCGTTLSSHEVAQNYQEANDPSVWALFPVRPGQKLTDLEGNRAEAPEGLHLVAWTTTPWTLTAHVGLAVHPELVYRVVRDPGRPGRLLLFGHELETPVPLDVEVEGKRRRIDLRGEPAVALFRGRDLDGLRYDRPYRTGPADLEREAPDLRPTASDQDGWFVFPADYVTATEGTGLVHTAPPFGEDDYASGVRYGLPFFLTIDSEGRIAEKEGIEPFVGLYFKEADPQILAELKERGLLLHSDRYRHNYPFCWRCDQPLLYYATVSWFVRTTARKAEIVEANRKIGWQPAHIGEGRFGKWLENMVDWALSRKRYWGTPLPIWRCDACEETTAVGSFAELFELAGREAPDDLYDPEAFNPHRPTIDEFAWACPADGCGGAFRRVDDVIDAWFDSGAMSFAQHHYPFENRRLIDDGVQFPADFISEGVDQTRGWFYTLHVLGVLLFGQPAYRNCIVLGHVNDENGRKMSKRLGNVVDPLEVLPQTGADALRWYFYASNPEQPSRFSARLVRESTQRFLIPLWNAVSFFTIYANLDGWRPGRADEPSFATRPALDRWILLRLDRLVVAVSGHLDGYRVTEAARELEAFVDDLTNWYIRRSRNRFWEAGGTAEDATGDKESAYQALYHVLATLARILAPFTPFVADVLHGHLVRSLDERAADSVHLVRWPEPAPDHTDPELETAMAAVQRIVRLGHAARNVHSLKTRQPLASVTLVTADDGLEARIAPYLDVLRDELNVKAIRWAEDRSEYVHHEVQPVWSKCGPRFGKRMPLVKKALIQADGDFLAAELERRGALVLELPDEMVELGADEVEVRLVEREGTATQGDRELLVALDTELTSELVAEGWAREAVNRIQQARKAANLEYSDRIHVRYAADEELSDALATHGEWIASETLAVTFRPTEDRRGLEPAPVDDHEFSLAIERA